MSTTNRNYRATFIIDNSGKDESIEQILDVVKNDITAVDAQVTAIEDIGRKDFVRITNPKRVAAHYVHVTFNGPPGAPAALKERLRLNHSVYRTFIETL